MILSEVRDYIRQRGKVTLQELNEHFGSNPESLRGMLDFWIGKGSIHREFLTPSCNGCSTQCEQHAIEIYLWGGPSLRVSEPESTACGCR